MIEDMILKPVLDCQSPNGAFPSILCSGHRRYLDWNGFTTAQVLRALRYIPESDQLNNARHLALDFLKRCEDPEKSGAFRFWPKGMQPDWIPELPPDADDTSIIIIEMVRNKRIDISTARMIASSVLLPHRLIELPQPSPPWIRSGAFLTWLRSGPLNIVDCCVNANVIALFSYLGLDELPGFDESCEMIEGGIRWSKGRSFYIRTLTPFYPDPAEFVYAIDHAVECGAKQLEESLELLNNLSWMQDNDNENSEEKPICGNAYVGDIWHSRVLHLARNIGRRYSNLC